MTVDSLKGRWRARAVNGAGQILRWALSVRGMRIPPAGIGLRDTWEILRGSWEAESVQLLRRMVKPGMVVADVGANVGVYTRVLSELVGTEGRVVAFEPDPESFGWLKRNTASLKNVELVEAAISDRDGLVELHLNQDSGTMNSLSAARPSASSIQVQSFRLDDFFAGRELPSVVKIDVEGAEPLVLRGMPQVIAAPRFCGALVEYCPANYEMGKLSPDEIFDLFTGVTAVAVTAEGLKKVASSGDLRGQLDRHGYVNCWF